MLIRNNKTKQEQEVTPDEWAAMEANGLALRFTVKSRLEKIAKPIAQTPPEVIQLNEEKKPKRRPKDNEPATEQ